MAEVTGDIARMTTITTGTGTITLGSAVTGFKSFADAGVGNGDVISYAIEEGNNREVGYGTYTASGTTLTRTVIASTNSDAAISLSGAAQVFLNYSTRDIKRAGDINMSFDATPQTGEVELDGATITGGATTYPIVAARYAWMVSGSNLILPDMRGRVPRGYANGSSNDPDRAARTARVGDSATGDNPGTYQAGALENITGAITFMANRRNVSGVSGAFAFSGLANQDALTVGSGASAEDDLDFDASRVVTTSSNETRMINCAVMFTMRMG